MYYTTINETEEAVAGLFPAGRVLYYYICIILLHMCPHTTVYVSSNYYIYVLILYQTRHDSSQGAVPGLYPARRGEGCHALGGGGGIILLYMCPHTTIYVPSCYYMCVLILVAHTDPPQRDHQTYADVC
jgi:hypothetical protein